MGTTCAIFATKFRHSDWIFVHFFVIQNIDFSFKLRPLEMKCGSRRPFTDTLPTLRRVANAEKILLHGTGACNSLPRPKPRIPLIRGVMNTLTNSHDIVVRRRRRQPKASPDIAWKTVGTICSVAQRRLEGFHGASRGPRQAHLAKAVRMEMSRQVIELRHSQVADCDEVRCGTDRADA